MIAAAKKKKDGRGRPALGCENEFRRYGGNPHIGENGWRIYHAKHWLDLPIKTKHVKRGKQSSPTECVLAYAGDDYFDGRYVVEVACTQFRVIDEKHKRLLVFKIPSSLRKRLRLFDEENQWVLPPGLYRVVEMPHPAKKKKKAAAGKNLRIGHVSVVNAQTVNGRSMIRRKPKKVRAKVTRSVSRGRIVRYAHA